MVAPNPQRRQTQLFPPGMIHLTLGALVAFYRSSKGPEEFLRRHFAGDWGEISEGDKKLNDTAVKEGGRILSAYQTTAGDRIWIISEADRSVTNVELNICHLMLSCQRRSESRLD